MQLNPAAFDDWEVTFKAQYAIPFDDYVELSKNKPHIFVYFGRHIDTVKKAATALGGEDTPLARLLLPYFPKEKFSEGEGGGWLAMQTFEGQPIRFVYMYIRTPLALTFSSRCHLVAGLHAHVHVYGCTCYMCMLHVHST